MSKKSQKLSYDVRSKIHAEAERDAAQAKVAALEAQLAALKTPPVAPPPPAAPAAPPSRLAEFRALKAQGGVAATQFALEHSLAIAHELDLERNAPTSAA